MEQYKTSPYYRTEVEADVSQYFAPIISCIERARQEMIIKDLPQSVIATLTLDVASLLVQKQSVGLIDLTDELVEQIIDALWEAIRE